MESETPLPHVLMISFPSQGNINPLLRLAKQVAAKGVLVTFTTTSDTGRQIISSSDVVPADDGIPVGSGRLRFEFLDMSWNTRYDKKRVDEDMLHLETVGPVVFADLIRKQSMARQPVTYVVNNLLLPWVVDVATDMGIPCAVLWVQSCTVFSTYYHYHRGLVEFPTETNPNISVCLPGIPTMTPDEITTFLLPSTPNPKSLTKVILEQFSNIDKASRVFINSFTELEPDVINAIARHAQLIPVGPLVEPEFNSGSTIRGDLIKATDDCLNWLDTQAPQSVIYISLGSLCTFTKDEMTEIAYELTTNDRPFLWVVRPESCEFLPQGFLKEVKGKGMVVAWSPQDSVLNHKSTGCFLTHCGWNSTLETLTAGVPVITYPQLGDQVTDAKFLVDIYKIGVRLKAPVQRNALHAAIEGVMDGPDADAIKEHAAKWKQAAKIAVRKGGSSDRNIQAFVDELIMKRATAF